MRIETNICKSIYYLCMGIQYFSSFCFVLLAVENQVLSESRDKALQKIGNISISSEEMEQRYGCIMMMIIMPLLCCVAYSRNSHKRTQIIRTLRLKFSIIL